MTTIYILYFCGCAGEIEVVFDKNGKPLDWWSTNDANWRGEYMGPVFKKLGINVLDDAPEEFDGEDDEHPWFLRAVDELKISTY